MIRKLDLEIFGPPNPRLSQIALGQGTNTLVALDFGQGAYQTIRGLIYCAGAGIKPPIVALPHERAGAVERFL